MTRLRRLAQSALAGLSSPGVEHVTLGARFGHDDTDPRVRGLSAIPQAVVLGFEQAMGETDGARLHARLALVDELHRGFAYEGATMAASILDALPGRLGPDDGAGATTAVMTQAGLPHLLLNYIGIGFAMARLPRALWPRVLPHDIPSPYHPGLAWLAVDGYGFDLAYFNPERYLRRQERPCPYAWLGGQAWYFEKAVDQGIGRALWFAHAGSVAAVARAVERFAPVRRDDLWSGVGLAATFAGHADDLAGLAPLAGNYAPDLRVGALLAAKARTEAGCEPPQLSESLMTLTGLSVESAVLLVDSADEGLADWPLPRYATWRDRLRSRLENDVSGALSP